MRISSTGTAVAIRLYIIRGKRRLPLLEIASPTCANNRKRALTLADLADQEWLLPETTIPVRHRIDDAFRARGLPAPRLRVETDFGNTSLLQLLRGTSLLCVGGADALGQVTGLRALDLRAGELELDRRIGAMHRAGAYVPPLAQRMIALLQESAAARPDHHLRE